MDKKRPAIALLITLSVIVAMITLMGVMFGYLNSARDRAELKSSLIQADLLMTDLPGQIRQIVGIKPTQSSMFRLENTPLISIALNGEFSLRTRCVPVSNRANLAWLGNKITSTRKKAQVRAQKRLVKDILEHMFDSTDLKDSSRLRGLIFNVYKEKKLMVFGVQGRVNKKEGIIPYRDFHELLDQYYFETGDERAYAMPWQKYFVFGVKTERLDRDFLTAEMLAFMYDMQIPEARDYINAHPKSGFKFSELYADYPAFKNRHSNIVSKKTIAMAKCTSSFKFRNGDHSFGFYYIGRKAEGFEFFSK